jgi:hypothetical protein
MKKLRVAIAAASLMLLSSSDFVGAQEAPTYINGQLITADPARRIVVLQTSGGKRETFDMDDTVGSVGSVKRGDQVIVTVTAGHARRRITAITKSSGTPSAVIVTSTPVGPVTPLGRVTATQSTASVRDAFSRQVAQISRDAAPVDSAWAGFVTACKVQPFSANDGRPWFGLWDNRVQADYSNGQCRDLFNQIISSGEGIKRAMAAAEEVANKSLSPGEIRDIRKMSQMDWDGWMLPPPQKREP